MTERQKYINKMVKDHEKREERISERYNNMEYSAATDQKMQAVEKRINKEIKVKNDTYNIKPYKETPLSRRNKTFPAFCRDFISQNEGALAQDLLNLHSSPNPNDQIQFIKFLIEMGKIGYAGMNLDEKDASETKKDIYAQLEAMSTKGIAPAIGKEHELVEEETPQEQNQEETEQPKEEVEELETEDLGVFGYNPSYPE